jgi:hydroxymethylpyrimidine/phosphomethylpyrimidine kinase
MSMKYVLTIAGHDLSSGAGITKDLEVFETLGLHGLSVPTSFVVQGPTGVDGVVPVPIEVFSQMLEKAGEAFLLSGIKVGVLPDAPHVERVAAFLAARKEVPVVLDPVVAAKNEVRLITEAGLKALVERLLPLGLSCTPNLIEAERLVKKKIENVDGMEAAARAISRKGAKHVLLKGGHLGGDPVDLLFDGTRITTYKRRRIERTVHGTGCIFSSGLCAFMASGYPVREAFLETERLIDGLLPESRRPGEGAYYYAFPSHAMSRDAEKWHILQALHDAAARLEEMNMVEMIPAVQLNMGYALREARTAEDVAAFPGRIGSRHGRVYLKGAPEFGVSSHVARLCLTYMKYYPYRRAAVDIRYDEAFVARARKSGLSAVFWDRRQEPDGVKGTEGRSLDFLVESALKAAESPPDIIYDHGDIGKEPIIRLFARDPQELLQKMEMIRHG